MYDREPMKYKFDFLNMSRNEVLYQNMGGNC